MGYLAQEGLHFVSERVRESHCCRGRTAYAVHKEVDPSDSGGTLDHTLTSRVPLWATCEKFMFCSVCAAVEIVT